MSSYFPIILCALGIAIFTGCEKKPTRSKSTESKDNVNQQLLKEFEVWQAQQDPKQIKKYKRYLADRLEHPPSLFELSYNIHIKQKECSQHRFALAPENQWKNIVKPLQLLEKLKKEGFIEQYKIVSVYRGSDANTCSRGASKSKHLGNYAVDFRVYDQQGHLYAKDDLKIVKALCQFWKTEGKKRNMGLGTYGHYKFHIDVQGYRTWGYDYKRASSECL